MLLTTAAQHGARASHAIVLAGILLIALIGFVAGPELRWEWRAAVLVASVVATSAGAWFGLLNRGDRKGILQLVSRLQPRAA
jgi:hypothetical protein